MWWKFIGEKSGSYSGQRFISFSLGVFFNWETSIYFCPLFVHFGTNNLLCIVIMKRNGLKRERERERVQSCEFMRAIKKTNNNLQPHIKILQNDVKLFLSSLKTKPHHIITTKHCAVCLIVFCTSYQTGVADMVVYLVECNRAFLVEKGSLTFLCCSSSLTW